MYSVLPKTHLYIKNEDIITKTIAQNTSVKKCFPTTILNKNIIWGYLFDRVVVYKFKFIVLSFNQYMLLLYVFIYINCNNLLYVYEN